MTTKAKDFDLVQYILRASKEDILEGKEVQFAGETEQERARNTVKFFSLRAIIQRYAQSLTPDDNDTLLGYMKETVVQKVQ